MGDNVDLIVLDNCCGCIELETGCFIIGYLQLIGYIILGILLIRVMVVEGVEAANSDSAKHEAGVHMMLTSVIALLLVVVFVTFTIALLVGLHKNKPGYVKGYLIYGVVSLVPNIMINLIKAFSNGRIWITGGAVHVLTLPLTIHFLLVVRSQYLVMKQRGPAIYRTA